MNSGFGYRGDPALEAPIFRALGRVVDPELALTIVDVGLVYDVAVDDDAVRVRMTMTSAACPVADVIVEDVQHEVGRELPDARPVEVEVVWDPPWTPERLSERARRFMG